MGRYATLIAIACALPLLASGAKKAKRKKAKESSSRGERMLKLRSIDLERRRVMLELGGFKKPPAPNLFRMTDIRGRHYIAASLVCDPPFPSGTRVCELEIPEGYERHKMVALELHTGGLTSKTIGATPGEIESAWTAAQLARSSPPDMGAPRKDGGS